MKKTFFSSLLLLFIFQTSNAQKSTSISSENSFIEWNVGIAFIADENFPFPGSSVLWGKTYVNKNDFIFKLLHVQSSIITFLNPAPFF